MCQSKKASIADYVNFSGQLLQDEKKTAVTEADALRKKCREADDKVREMNRMNVHECFAVTKLTDELLDEYVENIEVHPGNEIKISWK